MPENFHRYGRWSKAPTLAKKQLLWSFYLTTAITLIATVFYFFAQPHLPFFYTLPLDSQMLAPKLWLFLFPSISLGITLLHMILLGLFYDLDELILRLFANATTIIQSILLLALVRIIVITW
ncbi:MAG: hypothetical protein WDZ94_00600 [Patescibacteria group bacterium]